MKILAIETSCDETAVAVIEAEGGFKEPHFSVLSHQLYSQASKHAEYGGVYPNLAKRLHSQNLIPLLKETLKEAGLLRKSSKPNYSQILQNLRIVLEREPELFEQFESFVPTIERPNIDAIAVTQGPGLEPALWVGLNFAKALSLMWSSTLRDEPSGSDSNEDVPLIPVNHMEGHIFSVLYQNRKENPNDKIQMTNIRFPALALLISGGHTQLVLAKDWMQYEMLGETRDDAVGEGFDKVARILGLPYPGGPEISRLAGQARYSNIRANIGITKTRLPRPMIDSDDYDFSFSGLKTAVLYLVKKLGTPTETQKQHIAREFEDAVTDVLIHKTKKALREYRPQTLVVAGGVIANTHLRDSFEKLAREFPHTTLRIPHPDVTGDNAVMIGIAGYLRALSKKRSAAVEESDLNIRADGQLRLAA